MKQEAVNTLLRDLAELQRQDKRIRHLLARLKRKAYNANVEDSAFISQFVVALESALSNSSSGATVTDLPTLSAKRVSVRSPRAAS